MKDLARVAYEGFNKDGDWQKWTVLSGELADHDRVVDRLKSGGCCAFKGRLRCGAELKPDNPYTLGHAYLIFLCYAAAGPIPMPGSDAMWCMLAFFCERHQTNPTLDIDKSLKRRQEKEIKKFKKSGMQKAWFGF
jgi:hypothetical protein